MYTLLVPLFFFSLLWRVRDIIMAGKKTRLTRSLFFLHSACKSPPTGPHSQGSIRLFFCARIMPRIHVDDLKLTGCALADAPRFYYWEIVETVRKLVVIGFAVFFGPGSMVQLLFGTCASLMFFAVQMHARPLRNAVDGAQRDSTRDRRPALTADVIAFTERFVPPSAAQRSLRAACNSHLSSYSSDACS